MNVDLELERLSRKLDLLELELGATRRDLARVKDEQAKRVELAEARERLISHPVEAPKPPPLPSFVQSPPVATWQPKEAAASAPTIEKAFKLSREEEFPEGEKISPGWKIWLMRLQLWPPADGENTEIRLGAWWTTRVGMLLAVIGVVFFGVYVSVATPPWVKFVEMLAVCTGVAIGGLWLERRIERFGAVVFGGGLALLYFCAFAGYALPPVKVLSHPLAAAFWQLAAIGLIVGAAVKRRSQTIATMATGFGYVTAIFSRAGGLHEVALVMAVLLAALAIGFKRVPRWPGPGVLAMPGTYLVYAVVLRGNWSLAPEAAGVWPWLLLASVAAIFFCNDFPARREESAKIDGSEVGFQCTNSSLAIAAGLWTVLALYPQGMTEFCFMVSAAVGAMAWLRSRISRTDMAGSVMLIQALGLFTHGLISAFDGRTVALALLVQAWAMTWSARRLASRVMAWSVVPVAALAAVFFVCDSNVLAPALSATGAGNLLFVGGFAWLAHTWTMLSGGERKADEFSVMEIGGGLVAGLMGVFAVRHLEPHAWLAVLSTVWMVVVAAPALIWRKARGPLVAVFPLAVTAHVELWSAVAASESTTLILINAAAVLPPGVAMALWLSFRKGTEADWLRFAGALLLGVCVVETSRVLFALMAAEHAMGVMAVAGWALAWLANPARRALHLPWMATVAVLCGAAMWWVAGAPATGDGWWAGVVLALWALPVVLHAWRRDEVEAESYPKWIWGAQVSLATLMLANALPLYFTGAGLVLALATTALAVFGLKRGPGVAFALPASWGLWVCTIMAGLQVPASHYVQAVNVWLVGIAVLLAWVPAWVMARSSRTGAAWRQLYEEPIQTALATALTWLLLARCHHGAAQLVAGMVATGGMIALLRMGGVGSGRIAAGLTVAGVFCVACTHVGLGRVAVVNPLLGWVLVFAGGLLAMPAALAGGPSPLKATERVNLAWLFGALSLGLVFFALLSQRGGLAPYATVGGGVAAIAVFTTGLLGRLRPYRLLGLAGLSFCVVRVFIVDLDSTLHRIAAFVVLGLVLLWVGFSYHRFRHLVADEDTK